MKPMAWTCLLLAGALASAMRADQVTAERFWQDSKDEDEIEVLTHDEDGALRETTVWIVTFDGHGYVRTNDSRWLANIRRGSSVALRIGEHELPVTARESDDDALIARVEEQFKQKYGFTQRVMSFFRVREPTTLELSAL